MVLTGLIQGAGRRSWSSPCFRYRKYEPAVHEPCPACCAALFIFCYELYYLSYYLLAPTMLAAQLAVRFVSAIVFSGIICKLACDGAGQDRRAARATPSAARSRRGAVYSDED